MQATLVAVVLGAIFGAQLRLWSARQKERGTAKKLSTLAGASHVGSPTPSAQTATTTVSSNSGEDIWLEAIHWDSSTPIQIYESRMGSGPSKDGSRGLALRPEWPPKEGLPG